MSFLIPSFNLKLVQDSIMILWGYRKGTAHLTSGPQKSAKSHEFNIGQISPQSQRRQNWKSKGKIEFWNTMEKTLKNS